MHIDDQLIRLDENLEDITGHLDEQLLNTATVATGDELLTQEQQNFLFAAMPEVCLHFLFTFTEFVYIFSGHGSFTWLVIGYARSQFYGNR